jgi:hypothetical protein
LCKIFEKIGLGIGHFSRYALPAGWSSLVAREAHNLEVAGSNPAPATNFETGFLLAKGFIIHKILSLYGT